MMIDLDNLKYINDTYGHDMGTNHPLCSRCPAAAAGSRTVVARMSGDEFFVFLYGGASKKNPQHRPQPAQPAARYHRTAAGPGKASTSGHPGGFPGIRTTPADYEELIRYADFAMYKVKRTDKGRFKEFDRPRDPTTGNGTCCRGKETLNTIIERSTYPVPVPAHCGCRDG